MSHPYFSNNNNSNVDHQSHDHHDDTNKYKMNGNSYDNHHGHSHGGHDDHHGHSHGQPQSPQPQYYDNSSSYGGGISNRSSYTVTSPTSNNKHDQYNSSDHINSNLGSQSYFYESNITVAHLYNNLLNDDAAKRLAMWIVVMLCFTLYEIFYGAYLESLGLVSDGFHALFDCIGFIISLLSMLVGKKGSNREYTYGYDRWEILGVFSNGCFLLFVSFFLFLESVERILEPPHMHNHGRVISVALVSLMINVVGVLFFRGHSLTSKKNQTHQTRQDNFMTITSHILADSCTSVGVIVSTLLAQTFSLEISDSLISIIIACIIVYDALPICMRTGKVLLQTTPDALVLQLNQANERVGKISGVVAVSDKHFWTHSHGNTVGTMTVIVDDTANTQVVRESVRALYSSFINDLTIQIEHQHSHGGHHSKHDQHHEDSGHHHGHSHGGHDDHHGHSHGGHNDHGHSHGGHEEHDNHDDHNDHEEHEEHDDHHGHSHGGHDDHHGHSHGGHGQEKNNHHGGGHDNHHGHSHDNRNDNHHGHSHKHL